MGTRPADSGLDMLELPGSFPALLAGSACCAPAIVLILGIQVSSLFMTVFQVLIPVSVLLLLVTLKLILDRTKPALLHQ